MHLSWFNLGELACTNLLVRDYSKRQLVSWINTEIPSVNMNPFPCRPHPYHDARASLHVAPLTDVHTPLHAPSNWSAVFHIVAPLTNMSALLHAPSDPSAVFHFVAPLTDMHAPLHAPSDWSAVLHFVSLLIGIHDIYVFLLLSLLRDFDAAFAATLIAPALVIAMIQTHHDTK